MSEVTRRGFIGGTAALGGGIAAAGGLPGEPAGPQPPGPVLVRPSDPRYEDLAVRRTNQRFRAEPDYFYLAGTTEQVVGAVGRAVRENRRLTVRSGGHCYENFVGEGAEVVLDLCEMSQVYFDEERGAFAIEAGATLMQAYRRLYLGWGVTIPGGQCGGVAAGGHIAGGGYGPLSRRDGLTVDHLHAVEVVVVDRHGRARAVVATRDPRDPHHDLWWAHTGGGGGNFGVVTRYWMRDPRARGDDPGSLLPRPPAAVVSGLGMWPWKGMTRESFQRLLRNYAEWHVRNSTPGTPQVSLWGSLLIPGRQPGDGDQGGMILPAQIDAGVPGAEKLLSDFFAAVGEGVTPPVTVYPFLRQPWFEAVRALALGEEAEAGRYKGKSAYLRGPFTDEQAGVAYDSLTAGGPARTGMLWLLSYGGKVNTVSPEATATVERRSILKVIHLVTWDETQDGTAELAWVRDLHRRTFAATGGVPVPGGNLGGAYINYPDTDHADPAWNTSGVPWPTLYYGANHARLQRVKARWDPRGVFSHALSIKP